jgi:adenine-specific DNA methylase
MGSKKGMLKNGLGEMLIDQSRKSNRIFDPFCGSASVSWFLAENTNNEVIAGDLQKYSIDLANAVLLRNKAIDENDKVVLQNWIETTQRSLVQYAVDLPMKKTKKYVAENKKYCNHSDFNITKAYGGYYFSFNQSISFDILLKYLPQDEPVKSIALASLIEAASQCVASPGHTAQPFGTTENGLKAIFDAWKRDPIEYINRFIENLSKRHANHIGKGLVCEANNLLKDVGEGDLVFLDPPYSGVHYSRFYHVLETISRNQKITASGKGRYPAPDERPRSDFSLIGKSKDAMSLLLQNISCKQASAILTFPADSCSNGLSGNTVKEISKKYFKVKKEIIKGKFSTLGGNNDNRPARQASAELVLLLEPK